MSKLDQALVKRLAALCGVTDRYKSGEDEYTVVAIENVKLLLSGLGYDLSSNKTITAAIAQIEQETWAHFLPVVAVVHQGRNFDVAVRSEVGALPVSLTLTVTLEHGGSYVVELPTEDLQEIERATINGKDYVAVNVRLPEHLPLGYHSLSVHGYKQSSTLIVVPGTCYEPKAMAEGKKIWGSGIQLYSVRSRENWGMGDFRDLSVLIKGLAREGADFVGLNPLHSLYPANPEHASPYSPSSRTYGNVLYINPEMVPEFAECQQAQELFYSKDFQRRLAEAHARDYIDYSLVASMKYSILELIYNYFCEQHLASDRINESERGQAFVAYCEEGGESLRRMATFDALYEHFRNTNSESWGWTQWPKAFQRPDSAEVAAFVKENENRIRYYEFLQWLTLEQSAIAQHVAKESGMMLGVYRDLAVGVDSGGADVWSDPTLYCLQASVGAPPDALGPQGQNWGLPPFKPSELYNRAYEPFIRMVRGNMSNTGALRIDHAMGLFRLWWCPAGKGATDGTYVLYPLQDLLGIIKLESHRNQCLVFGEDLGVVPDEIKEALPPARMYSCLNGIHLQKDDHYPALDEYKVKAMCNLTCHDTPPLKGWWDGRDIHVFGDLGIFDEERIAAEIDGRDKSRRAVINTLGMVNELPWDINLDNVPATMNRELMERFSYYLARSSVQVVNIQLEDCMLIETSVNVPGTSYEYPNWRRRLTMNVDEFLTDQANRHFLINIQGCRQA